MQQLGDVVLRIAYLINQWPHGLWDACDKLGRTVVIDFGLAGLFDRFERTFGIRVTNSLLALVGTTIVVFCIGLIATTIHPVIVWLLQPVESYSRVELISAVIYFFLTIVAVPMILAQVSSFNEERTSLRKAREIHDENSDSMTAIRELFSELKAHEFQIERIYREIAEFADELVMKEEELERRERALEDTQSRNE